MDTCVRHNSLWLCLQPACCCLLPKKKVSTIFLLELVRSPTGLLHLCFPRFVISSHDDDFAGTSTVTTTRMTCLVFHPSCSEERICYCFSMQTSYLLDESHTGFFARPLKLFIIPNQHELIMLTVAHHEDSLSLQLKNYLFRQFNTSLPMLVK
mmetsp:Transcript_30952/g.52446  ORF Transcript_30952/g.52446 Transcript_30952/m.52446 type:complete len:153 (+) Transcript_30952:38-496(+)